MIHYTLVPDQCQALLYLVEIPGFEPGAIKGTDLQSAAVTYAARPPI